MAGVIFYELFIVFGLPLYYTAIKSSSIPSHTFYIIHDSASSIYLYTFVYTRVYICALFTRFILILLL